MALGQDAIDWIARVTGGVPGEIVPLGGGGRPGHGVDVTIDGRVQQLYLQQGRTDTTGPYHPVEREAEVLLAVEQLGVPVAHVWAVDADRGLMLLDRMPGVTWFHPPADPAEQESVARDFVTHLARWHTAPARDLELPTFQPVMSIRQHQFEQIAAIKREFEIEDARDPIDALARLELELLES